ncbi:MAG: MFS transporter [Clostridiaceae bacterium]|nr:MFS transporter [Clostridiaceae bacterium]
MATYLIIIIYIAFICLGLPDSLLGSAWPAMSLELSAGLDTGGIISMVITIGTIISSLLSYKLINRFGTGNVTIFSVLLSAIALVGFSISPSFIWLIVFAIPLGLGGGSVDAALNNYVALNYKPHHMSWLHSFWGIGATVGPVVMGYFMKKNNNWRGGYLSVSMMLFMLITLLFFTRFLWVKTSVSSTKTSSDEENTQEIAGNGSIFKVKGLNLSLLSCFFYCGAEMTAGLWGSSFLVYIKGLSPSTAASWISLYYAGITVGRLLIGFVSMKISSKMLIRAGQLVALSGAILLLLPFSSSLFSLTGLILIGLGCAPIYPSILHETPNRFGQANSQRIMGLQMASAYTGSTLLPPLAGFIAGKINLIVYPVMLLIYIVGMLISSEWINIVLQNKIKQST